MKLINPKIATAIAITSMLSTSVIAKQSHQEKTNEMIGLSTGAIIGTAIAGPVGGIVASIFGVMIADDVNSDKRLEAANILLKQKEQQLFVVQQNFEQSKERAIVQITSMDKALEQAVFKGRVPEIESNIQFKTASFSLEEHYTSQLNLIAQTLQNNAKLSIVLSGFSDKRGDSSSNQTLSEKRALAVKNYLINKGVREEQVITHYFGEDSLVSKGEYFEDDFFDRRVMLKISNGQADMTVAN